MLDILIVCYPPGAENYPYAPYNQDANDYDEDDSVVTEAKDLLGRYKQLENDYVTLENKFILIHIKLVLLVKHYEALQGPRAHRLGCNCEGSSDGIHSCASFQKLWEEARIVIDMIKE
jgi:hypothetical protein